MPGMSGYELARRLRQDVRLGSITLVAVTGWGQLEDRRLSKEAGFDHHLTKPVEAAEVRNLVAQLAARPGCGPRSPAQACLHGRRKSSARPAAP
jgi:CheY-like chemotaxis protein